MEVARSTKRRDQSNGEYCGIHQDVLRAPFAGRTIDVAAAVVSFVTASRSCINVLFLSFSQHPVSFM